MFCFQCEQTDRTGPVLGCGSQHGNCGKDSSTSDLQDVLIQVVKGIGRYGAAARRLGHGDDDAAQFACFALFTTLTNVNFTATRFVELIGEASSVRERLRDNYEKASRAAGLEAKPLPGPAAWQPAGDTDGLLTQAAAVRVDAGLAEVGADVIALRALVLYGLKGVAAYVHHAHVLGGDSPSVLAGVENTLAFLASDPSNQPELLEQALALGRLNLSVMELLDGSNVGRFGPRTPTTVLTTPVPGKVILVSGHDFLDLLAVLEQTQGTGIQVYTHGEMLPAHSYPVLKAFDHLAGNYGGAWFEQQNEFAAFPGPIVMTSNCIVEPRPAYRQRIFTTGPVGWPGVRHLTGRDFSAVVRAARGTAGFPASVADAPARSVLVGFGHDVVLAQADRIVAAVKSGAIRRFFVIGGCDGALPGRSYYSDFAAATPDDTVILTQGCAKYRFNQQNLGTVAGLPRLLDMGQCNDTYSAIRIASALAEAFDCSVNDLPLTLIVSWFEQKAIAVLLTLLALDIRNIRLGPRMPAFLTENVLNLLVETFGIRANGDAAADLAADLAGISA